MIGELVRQEVVKLAAQRYPYLLLAVVLGLPLLRMFTLALTPAQTALDVVSAPQLWADGMGWGVRMLSLVLLMLGAMAFSRERSLGTAKTVLLLPIRRRDWYAAKLLALVGLAWAALALGAGVAALAVTATVGWGDVVREGLVLRTTGEYLQAMAFGWGLTALHLLPLCAFALLIGLWFSNSGAAVGVAVLLGLLLESAGGLLRAGRYLFTHHLGTPFAVVERLGRGLPVTWEEPATLGLAVSLGSFVMLAAAGAWRWSRMDVTA